MNKPTNATGSLDNLASSLSDIIRERYGVAVSMHDVVDLLGHAVARSTGTPSTTQAPATQQETPQGPTPVQPEHEVNPALRSIEALLRAARSTDATIYVDFIEGDRAGRVTREIRGMSQVLGQFQGDFKEQFHRLTRLHLPVDVVFSAVVELPSDGSAVVLSTSSTFIPISGTSSKLQRVQLSVAPAKSAPIPFSGLGLTQQRHLESALQYGSGLCMLEGKGVHTTLRATAEALEAAGKRVAWIRAAADHKAVLAMQADVYIFETPMREVRQAAIAVRTASNALVFATSMLPTVHSVVDFLLHVGIPEQVIDEALLFVLRQQVAHNRDDAETNAGATVLLSELVLFQSIGDVGRCLSHTLPYRAMAVDIAEKTRAGKLSQETGKRLLGELFDAFV